jgi:hypothetical protein
MKNICFIAIAFTFLLGIASSSEAILLDVGGGMIYDTDLNITWLQNSTYVYNWDYAKEWADNLDYQGYQDWRLPKASIDGSEPCEGPNCINSEYGHLFYVELGNLYPGDDVINLDINQGPFNIMVGSPHWTGTEITFPSNAWAYRFYFYNGKQELDFKDPWGAALAVRDGYSTPLSPVPEPSTMLLLGSGLIGLLGYGRRRLFKK